MKVRKNISIDDKLLSVAEKKAEAKGFNFSAYVTHLINNDIGEVAPQQKREDPLKSKKMDALKNIIK